MEVQVFSQIGPVNLLHLLIHIDVLKGYLHTTRTFLEEALRWLKDRLYREPQSPKKRLEILHRRFLHVPWQTRMPSPQKTRSTFSIEGPLYKTRRSFLQITLQKNIRFSAREVGLPSQTYIPSSIEDQKALFQKMTCSYRIQSSSKSFFMKERRPKFHILQNIGNNLSSIEDQNVIFYIRLISLFLLNCKFLKPQFVLFFRR